MSDVMGGSVSICLGAGKNAARCSFTNGLYDLSTSFRWFFTILFIYCLLSAANEGPESSLCYNEIAK